MKLANDQFSLIKGQNIYKVHYKYLYIFDPGPKPREEEMCEGCRGSG